MELLLFGGTSEGRLLAQKLTEEGISVTCSVATEYGRAVIPPQPGLTVLTGRKNRAEMAELMSSHPFRLVVDATHPYASEVSENIWQAAQDAGLPYERLLRPSEKSEGVLWADSPQMAAQMLTQRGDVALLTTGSKDLDVFASVPNYKEKLWVRILPSIDSLTRALELGYLPSHIICMQGPFSREMNTATLHQTGAAVLVTKDSGKIGGFSEKLAAAREAGAELLVIHRPAAEQGKTFEELYRQLREEAEI